MHIVFLLEWTRKNRICLLLFIPNIEALPDEGVVREKVG